ncbi:MAG: GntR family transcriptional regulator [Rhodococcus sp.]|nr:GntR family transcriptional regulator [Rhodococcus sp. (in: high G+C Gram-positive bacteria)]
MRSRTIDRVSGVPLYGQIACDLESQLGAVYEPGDALPPVAELAEQYAVNRLTVREALGLLARRGLVETIRGKGTFAALPPTRFVINGNDDASLTSAMAAAGRSVENVVLEVSLVNDEQRQLELGAPGQIQRFESVRYVDDAPWSITTTWVDPVRLPGLGTAWTQGSLHAVLRERYDVRARRSTRTFAAHTASPAEAEILQVPVASPILEVGGINVDRDGRPVAVIAHRFRGDRVTFVVEP